MSSNNNNTRSSLEKLDKDKAAGIEKKRDHKVEKRRQLLRSIRKSGQDNLDEAEEPSYEAGGFDLPDMDTPGPSGVQKKPPRKRKAQPAKEKQPADEDQPPKKKKGKQRKQPTQDDSDDEDDDNDDDDNDDDSASIRGVGDPTEVRQ